MIQLYMSLYFESTVSHILQTTYNLSMVGNVHILYMISSQSATGTVYTCTCRVHTLCS